MPKIKQAVKAKLMFGSDYQSGDLALYDKRSIHMNGKQDSFYVIPADRYEEMVEQMALEMCRLRNWKFPNAFKSEMASVLEKAMGIKPLTPTKGSRV